MFPSSTDANRDADPSPAKSKFEELDFDQLLKQAQRGLKTQQSHVRGQVLQAGRDESNFFVPNSDPYAGTSVQNCLCLGIFIYVCMYECFCTYYAPGFYVRATNMYK